MPSRADGLPAGTVIRTSGHKGYDCSTSTAPADLRCALDISARGRSDDECGTGRARFA